MADRVSEIDDLIHRADLDGLVRLVDTLCADADWPALLELRNRSRAAVTTGRQLWPAATLAEYRLALVGAGASGRRRCSTRTAAGSRSVR